MISVDYIVVTSKIISIIVNFLWIYNNFGFRSMYMNLGITKKIQRSGVVMNPTIHPTRKRNVPFDIPISYYLNIII